MRVIVATTQVPFVEGGASLLVESLADALRNCGHSVDVLNLPFEADYATMPDQMLALRLLDISQQGDRLIAIRTPSYLLRHPAKVLWFIHHHRGAYDLWGTRYQGIPETSEGLCYRKAIMSADNLAFQESLHVFANSIVVANRLKEYNGITAEVLYPPLPHPERYRTEAYCAFVVCVSRLVHHKRQWLAIEAMRFVRSPVCLVIAGQPDPGSEDYVKDLRALVEKHELADRVTLISRWIQESEKVAFLANCLAVLYTPLDEDSYGYCSLEAYHSEKPVITTDDAGGACELVIDGENGMITAAEPEAIAEAIDRLHEHRELAPRMGRAGRQRIDDLGICWEKVITSLLA